MAFSLSERTYVLRNRHALDSVTVEQVSIPVFYFDPPNRHYINVSHSFICHPGVK